MFRDLSVDCMKVFARKLDVPRTLTPELELRPALDGEVANKTRILCTEGVTLGAHYPRPIQRSCAAIFLR